MIEFSQNSEIQMDFEMMNNQTAPENSELQEKIEELSIEKNQVQRDWLKILEYTALGTSAVGSILAWWFQQFLFAATPLTLTLGLNLLNKERLEKLLKQEQNRAIAHVENSIGELDSEIENIATKPVSIKFDITDNVAKLENNAISKEEIDNLVARIAMLEQNFNQIQETTETIEAVKSDLSTPNAEPTLEIKALETQLKKLQQQVVKLQKQNREVIKPYLQKLNRTIQKLENK